MRKLSDFEKQVNGTFKSTRATGQPVEWEPIHIVPMPPKHLDDIGQAAWSEACRQLLMVGKLAVPYLPMIEGFAVSYSTWRKAWESVRQHGVDTVIFTPTGAVKSIRPNPSVKTLTGALAAMQNYCDRLGFSPKAVEGVRVHESTKQEDNGSLLK
jgi:phage terminase small subunit